MDEAQDRLQLDSRLTELCRAWPWAEELAEKLHVSPETRYAIHLCLEEALANIVLHGYRNEAGRPIVIRSCVTRQWLYFEIDDEAPPFAPPAAESSPEPRSDLTLESIQPGGNGIPLLRRFAGSLDYTALPNGNRLTLGFPIAPVHDDPPQSRIGIRPASHCTEN